MVYGRILRVLLEPEFQVRGAVISYFSDIICYCVIY